MESVTQRALDHVVLPTRDLKVARSRLEQLGFTVAPKAKHPFGTQNACVYFADGTYLEPLAVYDQDKEVAAFHAGNVFAKRDWAYRYRRGEEGFSGIAFNTDDADADDARMRANGVSAGDLLEFSRDFVTADGAKDKASFRLAFASDPRAPDFLLFTCQRLNAPTVDRSALQTHLNGVTRIKTVIVAGPAATDFCYLFNICVGTTINDVYNDGLSLNIANGTIEFLTNRGFADRFGHSGTDDRGLQARAIVFGVPSLKSLKPFLQSRGVQSETFKKRLIVDPAPGQGTLFVFEVDHEQT